MSIYKIEVNNCGTLLEHGMFNIISVELSGLLFGHMSHGIDYVSADTFYYDMEHICKSGCRHKFLRPFIINFLRDKNLNTLLYG